MDLKEALKNLENYMDFRVRSYSGRGIHGRECLPVIVDSDLSLIELGIELGRLGINSYDVRNMRSDNMGLGMVYYWPRIPFEENDD